MLDQTTVPETSIDPDRLATLTAAEERRFADAHSRSLELGSRGRASLLAGVPMSWMLKWPGDFPIFFEEASGARLRDVDGNEFIDLCLGDTAAMAGHSPAPVAAAIAARSQAGMSAMLPTEDSVWVAEELSARFGLPFWQFCLSATDANRFALRLARWITERPRVLVFNWCYHGTVDESCIAIRDGVVESRPGNIGPAVDPTTTTTVIEFNDLEALRRELAGGEIACVIAEPALTNVGIVNPDPGYHEELRRLTLEYGTLLLLDETHTLCAGPGGMTARDSLEPDMLTIGKAIGGGVPIAAYGFAGDLAERVEGAKLFPPREASGGIGGTLAANALSLAAARATLGEVLTAEAFEHTIPLAEKLTDGVNTAITDAELPWHIVQLGCRAEYRYCQQPPRNGNEAANGRKKPLDRYMHLFAMNRGVLMTPFHSMALMSPATSEADVERHNQVFVEGIEALA